MPKFYEIEVSLTCLVSIRIHECKLCLHLWNWS